MSYRLLGSILIVALSLSLSSGYKDCIKPKTAMVNEEWFIKAGEAGELRLVEHSDCDNCEKEEAWSWLRKGGRTIAKNMCWTMTADIKGEGEMSLPLKCKYRSVEAQECDIDFSETSLKGKMAWGGNIMITMTDNSTYMAGATCIFGKENFWWIMSMNGEDTLPADIMTKIYKHFSALGFKSMENVAKPGISPLVFKTFQVKSC